MQLQYGDYCTSCRTAHHVVGGFFATPIIAQSWALFLAFFVSVILYQVYDGFEDIMAMQHTKWDILEFSFGIFLCSWMLIILEFFGICLLGCSGCGC